MRECIRMIRGIIGFSVLFNLCLAGTSIDLPKALREIHVSTDDELTQAIVQAKPGDHIILADGQYGGIVFKGIRGTAEAPILLMAQNPRAAVISGSRSGRNALFSDAQHIYLNGLRFTGGKVWGVTIGPAYPKDVKVKGCRNITLIDCEIDHAGQSLLKINGNSRTIRVLDCELHHSGDMPGARRPYAEGIYVGEGAVLTDRSHDILIQNNHIHSIGNEDNWGEAIDIKCQTYNVRILDNTIEEVIVDSGGAITALYDKVDYPETGSNPEILIRGNVIRDVRKREDGWHGAGICIGANGIKVQDNTVKNTEGPALMVVANAGNTTERAEVMNNHFEGKISINRKSSNWVKSPVNVRPLVIEETNELEVD